MKTVLKNAVKAGQISHTYLFSGSRGTGKTSLARILAKEALEELSRSGRFIFDRGASAKIILEHLALTLPIF